MFDRIFDYFVNFSDRLMTKASNNNLEAGVLIPVAMAFVFSMGISGTQIVGLLMGSPITVEGVTAILVLLGPVIALLHHPIDRLVQYVTFNQHSLKKRHEDDLINFAIGYVIIVLGSVLVPTIFIGLLMVAWLPVLIITVIGGIVLALIRMIRKAFEIKVRLQEHTENPNAHNEKE